MATADQVKAWLAPEVLGVQRQGPGVAIEVLELRVPATYPDLLVEVDVCVMGERWQVALVYDGPDASLVSGDLTDVALRTLELMVRTHLFEWWHTKDRERASARMGTRLG
ncbi:hypothetical protein ACMA1D_16925 [Streptomyces sp. 796.1]|uniref:hypothetical protein n=1 Tax=Streptomyces sp. 796.1 TaxID=3163029 RepID=UPI0039C9BF58